MCSVGHFILRLLLFVHCLFSPALSLCYSYDHRRVTCMTSVTLLTFSSSTLTVCGLSLCLVCHAFTLSRCSRRGWGPWLLNVYSDVFHQWCYARWTECNHVLYVFIRLWFFSCCLSPFSVSLYLRHSTLLYEKLLWMPFSPRLLLLFIYLFFLNRTTMVTYLLQVEK